MVPIPSEPAPDYFSVPPPQQHSLPRVEPMTQSLTFSRGRSTLAVGKDSKIFLRLSRVEFHPPSMLSESVLDFFSVLPQSLAQMMRPLAVPAGRPSRADGQGSKIFVRFSRVE